MSSFNSLLISGTPVSGKSALTKSLSGVLGWRVFSAGSLWRDEWKRKYPNGETSFEEYWRNTTPEENSEMERKKKEVFEGGNVIGELRYPAFTKGSGILRVFVEADMKIRIARAKTRPEYSGIPDKEIKSILNQREKDEVKMGRLLYGRKYDWRDPLLYDFVLNSASFSVEEEVRIITTVIKLGTFGK